jgi:phage terminase large subunit-like protein
MAVPLIDGKVDWQTWSRIPHEHSRRNPYHEEPHIGFYTDMAWQYAEDVVNEIIPAPKLIKISCQRTLDDYDKSSNNDPEFPFSYNAYKVFHICWFLENLVHVEGPLGGEYFCLEPYQAWIISQVFGWVYNESSEYAGYRRYKNAFIEVPRGNGKSFLSSGIAIYMLAADGERGAQVVSAATNQKQARIILDAARQMALEPRCSSLMRKIGVSVQAHGIFAKKKNGRFLALTGQGNRLDGLNIHLAAIDEIHAHSTRTVYDVLVTGAKKRMQSLIWVITTAGTDIGGIGYTTHSIATKVLTDPSPADNNQFVAIWSLDEGSVDYNEETGEKTEIPGDDWTDPAVWEKVNPCWFIKGFAREDYKSEANKALKMPTERANFMTKHLNVWFKDNMVCPFDIEIMRTKPVFDPNINWDDFKDQPCFAAIDLGSVSDMTALTLLFPKFREIKDEITGKIENELTVYSMNKFYLPRQAVRQSKISDYKGWEITKAMTVTEGNVTDYRVLRKDIEQLKEKFNIISIAYDGWNAAEMVTKLQEDGLNMMRMAQTVPNLSPSTKDLDRLIRDRRFRYDNPILLWHANNTVVQVDTNGNIKPKKEINNSPFKIDGIITNAMGIMSMIAVGIYESPNYTYEVIPVGY